MRQLSRCVYIYVCVWTFSLCIFIFLFSTKSWFQTLSPSRSTLFHMTLLLNGWPIMRRSRWISLAILIVMGLYLVYFYPIALVRSSSFVLFFFFFFFFFRLPQGCARARNSLHWKSCTFNVACFGGILSGKKGSGNKIKKAWNAHSISLKHFPFLMRSCHFSSLWKKKLTYKLQNLRSVGVSAVTGAGMDEFFEAIDLCVKDYYDDYKPIIDRLRAEKVNKQKWTRQWEINLVAVIVVVVVGCCCCCCCWLLLLLFGVVCCCCCLLLFLLFVVCFLFFVVCCLLFVVVVIHHGLHFHA